MEGRGPAWGGFVSLLRWCNTAICSQATEVIMQSAEIKQSQRIAMETNPLIVLPQLGERLPLQQLSAKAEQQWQPSALFTLPVQVCVGACVRTGEQLIYFWMKYKESRPEFSQRAPPSLLQRTLSLWPVDAKFLESSTFIAECRWRFNPLAAAMTSATFLNSVFLILQAKLETFFFFPTSKPHACPQLVCGWRNFHRLQADSRWQEVREQRYRVSSRQRPQSRSNSGCCGSAVPRPIIQHCVSVLYRHTCTLIWEHKWGDGNNANVGMDGAQKRNEKKASTVEWQ